MGTCLTEGSTQVARDHETCGSCPAQNEWHHSCFLGISTARRGRQQDTAGVAPHAAFRAPATASVPAPQRPAPASCSGNDHDGGSHTPGKTLGYEVSRERVQSTTSEDTCGYQMRGIGRWPFRLGETSRCPSWGPGEGHALTTGLAGPPPGGGVYTASVAPAAKPRASRTWRGMWSPFSRTIWSSLLLILLLGFLSLVDVKELPTHSRCQAALGAS